MILIGAVLINIIIGAACAWVLFCCWENRDNDVECEVVWEN